MSITDKTNRLVEGISVIKRNLTTALQNKGVTVAPEARLKDLPALVDSIEVGGGSTTDKQVLVLSGFSSAETAIYGVDLNGEYVLVSADVPSYDRVWVCEANGVQLMYKSAWGYWGLVNNTASGGNTYTYGEGNNPYKADGSSAQWQTQGANISATAVVKGSNNGGDTGGGDTPGVTYLYTVSGSSRAEVNGDYWQDGTKNGKGKYTNGSCDMVWIGSYWAIGPIGYNGSGAPYHSCWEDIATPNLGSSWSGVTVTEYAGNSGEGGESGGETQTLIVSGFNSYYSGADGEYMLTDANATGTARVWTHKDNSSTKIHFSGGSWTLGYNGAAGGDLYTSSSAENPYDTDWYWCGSAALSNVSVTVAGGSSSDSEDNTETVAYLVSNDGFTGDLAKYAGTYTQTNATAAGTSAIYKNENNCYMYWHGTTWGWVFSSSEGGYPDVITYETSDDPTQATNKGYWYNESAVTNMQPGTVTLVGNGSGGGSGGGGSGYNVAVADGEFPALNGNYYEADAPSWGDSVYTEWYKHESSDYYLVIGSTVEIRPFDDYGFISPAYVADGTFTDPTAVNFIVNQDSGAPAHVTITEITGGGTSNVDYIVSGAGTEVVNGDYVAYESSWTSYKHTTNDIWLWYDSNLMKWYICMTGPGITGVAEVYYETPVDCPDPTIAGWSTSIGSAPAPTVTQG